MSFVLKKFIKLHSSSVFGFLPTGWYLEYLEYLQYSIFRMMYKTKMAENTINTKFSLTVNRAIEYE